jgi:hypothetical protein
MTTSAPFIELQRSYWQPAPSERSALLARGIDALTWVERLRLHHLLCIELFQKNGRGAEDFDEGSANVPASSAADRLVASAEQLLSPGSPFRARYTMLWQGPAGESENREPDLQGLVRNASLTHLGCLEAITIDEQMQPTGLKFIPFDDIRGVLLGRPSLFRAAKVLYECGRDEEMVCLPLIYGLSWQTGESMLTDGRITRFCCNLSGPPSLGQLAIGLGHQDLFVSTADKQMNLVGLGSPGELAIALEMVDPRFDEKCRGRGIDPEEIRKRSEAAERNGQKN